MIGFSKALAAEGARSGVDSKRCCPCHTGTPMVEQMKPEVLSLIQLKTNPTKRLA